MKRKSKISVYACGDITATVYDDLDRSLKPKKSTNAGNWDKLLYSRMAMSSLKRRNAIF
jgi:hypothetical protein